MRTSSKVVLLLVVSLGVAAGIVHLFAPGGIGPLLDKALAALPSRAEPTSAAPVPVAPAAGTSARREIVPEPRSRTGTELVDAEQALDAGDFSRAIDLFLEACVVNRGEALARATRGLHRAALAWGLTNGTPRASPIPADPEAELARRLKRVELEPSEEGWLDLTSFAASTGLTRRLPFLTAEAVKAARAGGPVEAHLERALATSGPRRDLLRNAMVTQGLLAPPEQLAPTSSKKTGPAKGTAPAATHMGAFTPATAKRLAEAAELEKKGAAEYELTGPDSTRRQEHRKAARELLTKARDIYQAAEEEDPDSVWLSRRLRAVMEMLAQLRKDGSFGD